MGLFGDIVDAVGDAAGDVVDAVGDAIEDGVDAVGDAIEDVVETVEDAVDAIGDVAEDALEELAELAGDALDAAEDVYDAFAELAEEAWKEATDFAEDAWNTIADAAEDAWKEISDAAEDAWESISEAAEDAWDAVVEAVEDAWERVQAAVEVAVEAAAAAVEHIYDAAASAYENAVDAIERALTWLGDLIKDVAYAIAMLGACLAGIIVHNLAEADNILTNFWKLPKRLSDAMKAEAAPLFPNLPLDRVYYIDDANLSANHFGKNADAMTFSHVELAGVNFAYMIYIDDAWSEGTKAEKGLMIHELVHCEQYRRFGFEDAFACAYGVGYADAGFSYENNPLESQAFDVQAAYLATP
jgi:phage-related minor tail protein